MLLCYEVTRDLSLEMVDIDTPVAPMKAPKLSGKKLTLAPILRAGAGFLDGMLALVPSARVAHIGLYRDPTTLQAVEYFFKAPQDLSDRMVILLDPMLATGNSACAAVALLKSRGARDIRFVCLLAAPEGIARFHDEYPDIPIWTAAVDERLNDHGYIVPGPRRCRRQDVRHQVEACGAAFAHEATEQRICASAPGYFIDGRFCPLFVPSVAIFGTSVASNSGWRSGRQGRPAPRQDNAEWCG